VTPTVAHCERHDRLYPTPDGCRECRVERNWDYAFCAFVLLTSLVITYACVEHYLAYRGMP